MFKVLIWDHAGISQQWLEDVADKKYIEVVDTITPDKSASEILLKPNAWDWLLIFERGARKVFDATIQTLRLPLDKVIYALDINSWLQRPKAAFTLIDMYRGGEIFINLNFEMSRQLGNFVTCTVEGLSYVATAKDGLIMRSMYIHRRNFSAKTMKIFYDLAKKYYAVDDNSGLFLDLGANIGTTGFYFLKKFTPKLNLLAFEPDAENFKMLRINSIMNDLDTRSTLVNCGLGDKSAKMTLYRDLSNPGANSVFQYANGLPTATVDIVALDDYLAENDIAAQEVKYIWIDAEGFETQILLGAKNLLAQNPAPILMECNLRAWKASGNFEDVLTLLAESYTHFIHVTDNDETLYPLDAMRNLEITNTPLGLNGDIFLIRKGAID